MPIHDAELASDQDSDLDYMPVKYKDFAFNAISLTNPARDNSALAETLTGDNEYRESPTFAVLWGKGKSAIIEIRKNRGLI